MGASVDDAAGFLVVGIEGGAAVFELFREAVDPVLHDHVAAIELGGEHVGGGTFADARARLFHETRFVGSESLRIIGPDFADPPPNWLIHQKWKCDGVCPRHRTPLRKAMIGGRTTAWCPRCQR